MEVAALSSGVTSVLPREFISLSASKWGNNGWVMARLTAVHLRLSSPQAGGIPLTLALNSIAPLSSYTLAAARMLIWSLNGSTAALLSWSEKLDTAGSKGHRIGCVQMCIGKHYSLANILGMYGLIEVTLLCIPPSHPELVQVSCSYSKRGC